MGDVMSRFGSQETILQAMTTELVVAVLDGVMCCTTLTLMVVFAPGLSAIVLAGALLYAGLRWASYTPLRQASMESIVWGARRDSHFLETLRGIATIKMFNGHDERRARWLNLLVETVNRQLSVQKLNLVFRTAKSLLLGAIGILIVWLGAERVLAGTFSVGMLVTFHHLQTSTADRHVVPRRPITTTLPSSKPLRIRTLHLAAAPPTRSVQACWPVRPRPRSCACASIASATNRPRTTSLPRAIGRADRAPG